jgi:hypothetical protein
MHSLKLIFLDYIAPWTIERGKSLNKLLTFFPMKTFSNQIYEKGKITQKIRFCRHKNDDVNYGPDWTS